MAIVIANVVMFMLQVLHPEITHLLAAGKGQPWYTLLTYMFLHGNVNHIFSNLFFTAAYSVYYESTVGSKRFLTHWLLCGVGSAAFHLTMPTMFPAGLIGASGVCNGIFALSLLNFRKNPVYEFFALLALSILFLMNLVPGIYDCIIPSSVGHMGHVGGMLVGVLIYCFDSKSFGKRLPKASL